MPWPWPDRIVDAVAIGTSAGGIEALSVLLPALPGTLRPPVFVVLHLTPAKPSLLVEIFGRKCRRPVREAEDKSPVEPGVVYFAPPDYHMLIDDGPVLSLAADEAVNFSRPSIDVLFESAADVYGAGLLGIILTGASHDGAAGLAAVQAAGGLTVVQDSAEAYASAMTDAAVRRSAVDRVMTLKQIADVLRGL